MELLDQVASPLRVIDGIASIERLEPLDGYQGEIMAVVRQLLAYDADVLEITQAVAHVNDALTRRLLSLAEAALGPPPCDYAWLALGSHGRGEQVLSSDQDSALAFDDRAEVTAGDYFRQAASLVVTALARAGLPLCDGGYMATQWCRPLGEFRRMFRSWVEQPQPDALLQAEVFLDVRPVHGNLPVDVLDGILVAGGSRGPFRVQMARAAVAFKPPLGFLGRLKADNSSLDIKRAGTAAIVLLARLYALAAGSSARTTVQRLDAAATAGTLSRIGAGHLAEAYRFLTGLRLRHQVDQVSNGRPADNRLSLDDLSQQDHRRLRDALRAVRDVQEATASRFATHTVT
jgi:CBS domain-containing protein